MLESFGRLALVGEPIMNNELENSSPVLVPKRVRLLSFVSEASLRIYCLPDTRASVQWALQQEDDLGGR